MKVNAIDSKCSPETIEPMELSESSELRSEMKQQTKFEISCKV